MKSYDYLIIGGGIAGVTAAETIRENDPHGTIAILSEEPHILYSRVLLPGYLKRRIPREKLFLRHPGDFTARKIDLLLGIKAVYVDVKFRRVGLPNREMLGFKKLLLASGGKVRSWEVVEEKPYIYRLQTLEDADRLLAEMDLIKNPIVIGASFISLEFLEIFILNDIKPTLLVRDDFFFKNFVDHRGGEMLRVNFERHGIRTQFNDSALELKETEGNQLVRMTTKAYRQLDCDSLALGIGLERNIDFIRGAGILLGEKGIRTNEHLETNIEGIFAAGDVAEFQDIISGKYRLIGNWTNAFLHGKTAGINMAGKREPFRNVSSYSITNLGFQITALGECGADLDSETRINPRHNQYERFFIQDDILVGATLINRFQDKPHLAKLIESRVNISNYRDSLRDFEFDVQTIPIPQE